MKVLLTLCEKRILELLAKGYVPKKIAPMLGVSYATYKFYVRVCRIKLRAETTNQAIAIAVANRLISFQGEEMPEFEEG